MLTELATGADEVVHAVEAARTLFGFQGDPEGREENPLYVLATEENRRKRVRTQGGLEARYAPSRWLTFDGNGIPSVGAPLVMNVLPVSRSTPSTNTLTSVPCTRTR